MKVIYGPYPEEELEDLELPSGAHYLIVVDDDFSEPCNSNVWLVPNTAS